MTLPKVKRYAPSFCVQSEDLSMDETEDGDHVKYEDYERLEKAFTKLANVINEMDERTSREWSFEMDEIKETLDDAIEELNKERS